MGKKASSEPTNAAVAPAAAADDPFNAEEVFPDDGAVSSALRKTDRTLGLIEQALLFVFLAAVVLSASAQAIGTKLFHHAFEWSFDVVRDGVFAIAMLGAAFASHQQRHLAMDLLSKRLSPRGRLVLRVLISMFTIAVVLIFVRAGLHLQEQAAKEGGNHLISMGKIAALVPIGAGLVIVHVAIHMLIDVDYLVRKKLPPERLKLSH